MVPCWFVNGNAMHDGQCRIGAYYNGSQLKWWKCTWDGMYAFARKDSIWMSAACSRVCVPACARVTGQEYSRVVSNVLIIELFNYLVNTTLQQWTQRSECGCEAAPMCQHDRSKQTHSHTRTDRWSWWNGTTYSCSFALVERYMTQKRYHIYGLSLAQGHIRCGVCLCPIHIIHHWAHRCCAVDQSIWRVSHLVGSS